MTHMVRAYYVVYHISRKLRVYSHFPNPDESSLMTTCGQLLNTVVEGAALPSTGQQSCLSTRTLVKKAIEVRSLYCMLRGALLKLQ